VDGKRFDDLARAITEAVSRRSVLRGGTALIAGFLGQASIAGSEAACSRARRCGKTCCKKSQFCCNPEKGLCCSGSAECCNPDAGKGTCCPSPKRCAKPIGKDSAPTKCCPRTRQWFTTTNRVRCCPAGTRSLGTGITAEDGPCCPEKKYCSDQPSGGRCCPSFSPVCVDPSKGLCCTKERKCGKKCCPYGQICDGGTCNCQPGVRKCGDTCCHASAVGCEGSRCLNECDLSQYGCGG
jgi:hypothetical protein